MKHYIYVVAYMAEQDDGSELLAFRHVFINANNVDDAYRVGWKRLQPTRAMNDYVIALQDET